MLSVVLIVIVSGCTTIKESVHVHPENNTDSSRTPIASTHTRKEDAQLKKYEEAYRYRNGTIDVSIQHIPQNIRMNRITDPDIYIYGRLANIYCIPLKMILKKSKKRMI